MEGVGDFVPASVALLVLSPSFPLREGRGAEKGEVLLSDLSVWPAPPTSVEALHTAGAGALSNGASATEPRQQRAVSPQWSCHWADQLSGTTPRADRDLTDKN